MKKLGYNYYVKNMWNYKLLNFRLLLFGLDKTEMVGNGSKWIFSPFSFVFFVYFLVLILNYCKNIDYY